MEVIRVAGTADGTTEVEQHFAKSNGGVVAEIDGDGVLLDNVIRIAKVPGNIVIVTEDMATRAGCFTVG